MMKRPTMSISKAPAWREQAISKAAKIANPLLTSKVCFLEERGPTVRQEQGSGPSPGSAEQAAGAVA